MNWDPDALALLRDLAGEGKSAAEIARHFSARGHEVSKRAVIGAAYRNHIRLGAGPERAVPPRLTGLPLAERRAAVTRLARAGWRSSAIAEATGLPRQTVVDDCIAAGVKLPRAPASWTPVEDATLRRLAAEGCDVQAIAAALEHRSAPAVRERAKRLAVKLPRAAPHKPKASGWHTPGSHEFLVKKGLLGAGATTRRIAEARAGTAPAPGPMRRDLPPEPPQPHHLPLMEAGFGQCRWPVGGHGAGLVVCGDAVEIEGRPYCAAHRARATRRVGLTGAAADLAAAAEERRRKTRKTEPA